MQAHDDNHWVTVCADGKGIDDIFQEILERYVVYQREEIDKFPLLNMSNSLFKDDTHVSQ
jgi:hypothetical protein